MEKNNTKILKYGYMPDPSKPISTSLKKAKKCGADYIEFLAETLYHPKEMKSKNKTIKRELTKHGMFCTIHMAHWADLGSEYSEVRKAWLDECKKAINAARLVGAKKFLVHARPQSGLSMLVPSYRREIIENMTNNFCILANYAKIRKMRLVIENENIGNVKSLSITDLLNIARRVKNAGMALDVGHAFLGNNNKNIVEIIRKLGSRIEHCHFSDNRGQEDEHLPIGKGSINYKMVVRYLKRIGYGSGDDDTITLEIFQDGDKGFAASLRKIKKLWGV